MRYTMFVKRGSKRFSRGCGCCIFHEADRSGFVASLDICDQHYEMGMEPMTIEMAVAAKAKVTLSCGCSLTHDPQAGTYWTQCLECKAVFDASESGKVLG